MEAVFILAVGLGSALSPPTPRGDAAACVPSERSALSSTPGNLARRHSPEPPVAGGFGWVLRANDREDS